MREVEKSLEGKKWNNIWILERAYHFTEIEKKMHLIVGNWSRKFIRIPSWHYLHHLWIHSGNVFEPFDMPGMFTLKNNINKLYSGSIRCCGEKRNRDRDGVLGWGAVNLHLVIWGHPRKRPWGKAWSCGRGEPCFRPQDSMQVEGQPRTHSPGQRDMWCAGGRAGRPLCGVHVRGYVNCMCTCVQMHLHPTYMQTV